MKKKSGFTVAEVLIVVGIFLLMFAVLTPFVRMAKKHTNRINCANNLRRISLALHNYAADNNDAFPPALGALYPNYITDQKAFDCPATRMVGTKEDPNYDYTPGLTESSPLKEIIVQDREANHKRAGKNILRLDGSIEWVAAAR